VRPPFSVTTIVFWLFFCCAGLVASVLMTINMDKIYWEMLHCRDFVNIPAGCTGDAKRHKTVTVGPGGGYQMARSAALEPPAEVSLRLAGSAADIPAGSKARRAFERGFISDVSGALEIEEKRVTIASIESGSIVVNFVIQASANTHDPKVADLVGKLEEQAATPGSPLLKGAVTGALQAPPLTKCVTWGEGVGGGGASEQCGRNLGLPGGKRPERAESRAAGGQANRAGRISGCRGETPPNRQVAVAVLGEPCPRWYGKAAARKSDTGDDVGGYQRLQIDLFFRKNPYLILRAYSLTAFTFSFLASVLVFYGTLIIEDDFVWATISWAIWVLTYVASFMLIALMIPKFCLSVSLGQLVDRAMLNEVRTSERVEERLFGWL
jgi:hypothetical protein